MIDTLYYNIKRTDNTAKNRGIDLQLPIVILKKLIISDRHDRNTYKYINFQQNRISRSVKTVHPNVFAEDFNLHKLANTNSNFEKIDYFRHTTLYNVHAY